MKDIILIEGSNKIQCANLNEVIVTLMGEDYLKLTPNERKAKLKMLSKANCLGNEFEVKEDLLPSEKGIENKIIPYDEMTYIYSLLQTNKIYMLENIKANIFTKEIDKTGIEDNYIIVNKYASELLKQYIKEIEGIKDDR